VPARLASGLRSPLLFSGLLLSAAPAAAVDWSGYFRAGTDFVPGNAGRTCYALHGGSAGMKYRLGNECEIYGEFQFSQDFHAQGLDYRAGLMLSYLDTARHASPGVAQIWAEARGFGPAPEATVWIGKMRARRGDVHIVDTFFVDMSGVGAGVRGLAAGPGKLGVAFYRTDHDAERPGRRANVEWYDIDAGAAGTLSFFGTLTRGDFPGGSTGTGLTLRHDRKDLFGSGIDNTLWLQYAQGSAALNANFGDLAAPASARSWRLVESVQWQRGAFGGQALALIARERDGAGHVTDSTSAGGRVAWAFTRHFKLLAELGVSQFRPAGGETARLTKLTIAPALSIGPELMSRPEFRVYVTRAEWNRAAGDLGARPGRTSGMRYGAQVEWWF